MNIVINGTVRETLNLIDRNTGIDSAVDLIGNYGGLSDGQFTYDADQNVYRCDKETYEWWSKVIADQQALEDRLADLRGEHGSDQVQDVLDRVGGYDLEDLAAAVNAELDEAFPVHVGN